MVISQRTQSPILCLSMLVLIIFGVILTSSLYCHSLLFCGSWFMGLVVSMSSKISHLIYGRFSNSLVCLCLSIAQSFLFSGSWDFISSLLHLIFNRCSVQINTQDTSQMFQLKYISKSISVNLLFDLLFATNSKFHGGVKIFTTDKCVYFYFYTKNGY